MGQPAVVTVAVGKLVAEAGLLARALEVAARAKAPNTRRAYAATYRCFCTWLVDTTGAATVDELPIDALTAISVRAFRDRLEAGGATPATVQARLSALRGLAQRLQADRAVADVRARSAPPRRSPALTRDEYQTLLAAPDRRTVRGRRDLAILLLLGDAGLRRGELVRLGLEDIDEQRRQAPGRRRAIARRATEETPWVVIVRHAKRDRSRTVPLSRRTVEALRAWEQARPGCGDDRLFVSLDQPGRRPPARLSERAIGDIVAKHARTARLPDGHRTPHVLRHTFCTLLAEDGTRLELIRELAGHADIRTTARYIHVDPDAARQAIANTFDRAGRPAWAA